MNYGQQQAVTLLAGVKMGFEMSNADRATAFLEGKPAHVSYLAAIESEAVTFHNQIRDQPDLVKEANALAAQIIADYRLN